MKKIKSLPASNGNFYRLKVNRTTLDLPLFEVSPGIKIAIFNMFGETALVKKFAKALAKKYPPKAEVIVTAEAKSICLAYELSSILKIPYIVIRKSLKPYMVNSIGEEVVSITTGKPQSLWLDGKDVSLLKNKKVVIVDDVISTGGTLEGLRRLMDKAQAKVIAESAVFTEGHEEKWKSIISLGHLPVFKS